MAVRPGTDVYRVNVRGAGKLADDFDRSARAIQDEIVAELREFGHEAVALYRDAAYEDTGDLKEAIDAVPYFRAVRPRVRIVVEALRGHQGALRDGFDYLDVTRRGHASARITPESAGALKVHVEGHRNEAIYILRSSVSGVPGGTGEHPSRWRGDWTEQPEAAVDALADRAEKRLGRRIERRALR